MKIYISIIYTGFLLLTGNICIAQDSARTIKDKLLFTGQISVWGNYNHNSPLPAFIGGRYIPSLHYGINLAKEKLIDLEVSANIFGACASHPFDSFSTDGNIAPYRAWVRYSTKQLELRLGLQKINFGSATLLRPLMWFDQLDPRDPLKLTNGVWGMLGRYYFLNNANLWIWCLYGNTKPRPWDFGKTHKNIPEAGTRFQYPIPKGEVALTYHYRVTDTRDMGNTIPSYAEVPENRIGIDGKWDFGFGVWFEGAWINKSKNIGDLTNQEILNIGADNTYKIGKGLNVVFEQLLAASDKKAFAFSHNILFSGLSLSYPLGIVDNMNAIVYYDWKNNASYNFVNWNHNFKNISLYLMGYWNPENFLLPQQGNTGNAYSGKGLQIMLVYNY